MAVGPLWWSEYQADLVITIIGLRNVDNIGLVMRMTKHCDRCNCVADAQVWSDVRLSEWSAWVVVVVQSRHLLSNVATTKSWACVSGTTSWLYCCHAGYRRRRQWCRHDTGAVSLLNKNICDAWIKWRSDILQFQQFLFFIYWPYLYLSNFLSFANHLNTNLFQSAVLFKIFVKPLLLHIWLISDLQCRLYQLLLGGNNNLISVN